ncbi:MAG: CRISPR-associated protein [Clostridia bacterium]|nr:CRISPR-associated protein [Clostridia bacterium]
MYDFYANFRIKVKDDVDNLTNGSGKYQEVSDVLSRVLLLNTAYGVKGKFPNKQGYPNKIDPIVYARVGEKDRMGLKGSVHSNGNYKDYIVERLFEYELLFVNSSINSDSLPEGSWILEFPIVLEKPFLSKDDTPFYIIDNPVRKDKVFGIPFTSAMAWKGNLRWTMMKVFLEANAAESNEFAEVRFRHTLLFGTEKGWSERTAWTKYLDELCPDAKGMYREKIALCFRKEKSEDVHLEGMLYFYPTFWDKIDLMVINPHDRKTKTGKNPIYFEAVPAGAKGMFRLAYVPFYWLGSSREDIKEKSLKDLNDVVAGVREMMLTYGFSAKKSSGFGVVKDDWNRDESRVEIKGFFEPQKFGNFEELIEIVNTWGRENEQHA